MRLIEQPETIIDVTPLGHVRIEQVDKTANDNPVILIAPHAAAQFCETVSKFAELAKRNTIRRAKMGEKAYHVERVSEFEGCE